MSERKIDTSDVRRSYDRAAPGFDQRFYRSAATVARFRKIDLPQLRLAEESDGLVIEVGCGSGRLLSAVVAKRKTGVDFSLGLLVDARAKNLSCVAGDAHSLPLRSEIADVVLSGNAVFRYVDYEIAFGECWRILRVGGKLAVHQYVAVEGEDGDRLHLRSFEELIDPARKAGFRLRERYLWRNLKIPPYVVRLPTMFPFRWGRHLTVIFEK
jgi:ubiquinone/menaquinone biosynthesis C-methylase UbiE